MKQDPNDNLISRDARDVKAKRTTRQVLIDLGRKFGEGKFSSRDLCNMYQDDPKPMQISDASMRVRRLYEWGCILPCTERKGRKKGCDYQITDWGWECIGRWKSDNS